VRKAGHHSESGGGAKADEAGVADENAKHSDTCPD